MSMPRSMLYVNQLRQSLGRTGLFSSMRKVLSGNEPLKEFDYAKVEVGPNELCRGVRNNDFMEALKRNSLAPALPKEMPHPVSECDIGKQVVYGDPNLLSFTRDPYFTKYYGANRHYYPASGFIVVGALGAVTSNISLHAQLCPAICNKAQVDHAYDSVIAGKTAVDVTQLVIGCNETVVIVGRQDGVSFNDMYPFNFVKEVHHVIGTGRTHFNLVPSSSCLVDTITNKDYAPRAFSLNIALTTNPEFLELIESGLQLPAGHRLLTAIDAAVAMKDPELWLLAMSQNPEGTVIISSVPQEVQGDKLVDYLKAMLKPQLDALIDRGHIIRPK